MVDSTRFSEVLICGHCGNRAPMLVAITYEGLQPRRRHAHEGVAIARAAHVRLSVGHCIIYFASDAGIQTGGEIESVPVVSRQALT